MNDYSLNPRRITRNAVSFACRPPLRLLVLLVLLASGCGSGAQGTEKPAPARIGVMLSVSGPWDVGWRRSLEWAQKNANEAAGPNGRPLELVFRDTAVESLADVSRDFLDDPTILGVIGPDTSSGLFEVAQNFLDAGKPLVSPSATSGEFLRAFGGQKYLWRTVESDVAQVQTMLLFAQKEGISKVALLTTDDKYGATFFDWFGFFATELGISVTGIVKFGEQNGDACPGRLVKALEGNPELLVVVPSLPEDAVCIAREARSRAPEVRLLFSDAAMFPEFITELGDEAEGLEGIGLSPSPDRGFEVAHRVVFGESPGPYAANAYDAVLFLYLGLVRSQGAGGADLAESLAALSLAEGLERRWDADGIREALADIAAGKTPNIGGATGPLAFDREHFTDLVESTYGRWRVDSGEFFMVDFFSTGDTSRSTSISRAFASAGLMQDFTGEVGDYAPPDKTGMWALLAAGSEGWENYRHQADVLAQYRSLKDNGLTDDRIILILADDLAQAVENGEPGVVRNIAGGENLYDGIELDYRLNQLSGPLDVLDILAGNKSTRLSRVVEGSAGDNIFLLIVGHGSREGVEVAGGILTPADLAGALDAMSGEGRYRRMLIAVEACHGGVMGEKITAPGVLVLTGANDSENSFGANYDPRLNAWLADEFAYNLLLTTVEGEKLSLADAYRKVYMRVSGSHVSIFNFSAFGNIRDVRLGEFLGD